MISKVLYDKISLQDEFPYSKSPTMPTEAISGHFSFFYFFVIFVCKNKENLCLLFAKDT